MVQTLAKLPEPWWNAGSIDIHILTIKGSPSKLGKMILNLLLNTLWGSKSKISAMRMKKMETRKVKKLAKFSLQRKQVNCKHENKAYQ